FYHIWQDILCIPITTVASESAFSTGGLIVDESRSSLSPKTVEELVCAGDWIKQYDDPMNLVPVLLKSHSVQEITDREQEAMAMELTVVSIENSVVAGLGFGFLLGMGSALETLCGQAFGAGRLRMLGIYMQSQRSWVIFCSAQP
ncbi:DETOXIFICATION 33 protein, partial [Nymphaea thermarum]